MPNGKSREDASLLDVLIDGFEKNEVLDGFHLRDLPMPDESAAIRKFHTLVDEARRWKGEALEMCEQQGRRKAVWADLVIRQAGRGVMVQAKAPWFSAWWHERETWHDHPMGEIYKWLAETDSRRSE